MLLHAATCCYMEILQREHVLFGVVKWKKMEVGCACSEMEVGAVFSFDTGTDNSLGKRATSSNAIYLSIYVQLFFLESKCPSSDVCLLFEALRVYRSTGTAPYATRYVSYVSRFHSS